jgi:sulfide:quinone oxidoreductase
MARVLIIGGGFAAVVAAEKLAASIGREHEITVISSSSRFIFYPALVQLALGECSPEDIAFDLRHKLGQTGVRFINAELLRVDWDARKAEIAGEDFTGQVGYDVVLFAMGRRLATEKISGFFENAHHVLGLKAAQRFGKAVDSFREGNIVVGLCPGGRLPVPVCETAFALAGRFEREIDDGRITLKVVFPESLRSAFGGAEIHGKLEAAFAKHRINVHYDIPIVEVTETEIISSEKHRIHHDLLMLIPPFRGQAIIDDPRVVDNEDFIKVNDLMQVPSMENVYAAGDAVAFSGPKLAHMAVRQADVAAANIASVLSGREPDRHYYHEIATVIDSGGPESIYLHYGIWDDSLYKLKQGTFWSVAKETHDAVWRARHK